jgi:hypothetical protein
MLLLAINQKLPPTENININLSGGCVRPSIRKMADTFKANGIDFTQFKGTNIKQIEFFGNGEDVPTVYLINSDGTRSIRVLGGFYLSDISYKAINQQACISGVSGDNSFELAVVQSLPYYHSSNASYKKHTFQALEKICDHLNLSEQLKADFKLFFGQLAIWNTYRWEEIEELRDQFRKIDLPNMVSNWHLFSNYLLTHYNFYDKVEDIILNKPVKNNEEYFKSLDKLYVLSQEEQKEKSKLGRP